MKGKKILKHDFSLIFTFKQFQKGQNIDKYGQKLNKLLCYKRMLSTFLFFF